MQDYELYDGLVIGEGAGTLVLEEYDHAVARGAIEAWLSLEMMHNGWFNPTLNLDNVAPECGDLDYIRGEGRNLDCQYIMSNNFAFGGINTSIIFKRV